MSKPVTTDTFNAWREEDARFKDTVLDHVKTQTATNLEIVQRLSSIETVQAEHAGAVSRHVAYISGVVSAVIGAVVGAVFGRA